MAKKKKETASPREPAVTQRFAHPIQMIWSLKPTTTPENPLPKLLQLLELARHTSKMLEGVPTDVNPADIRQSFESAGEAAAWDAAWSALFVLTKYLREKWGYQDTNIILDRPEINSFLYLTDPAMLPLVAQPFEENGNQEPRRTSAEWELSKRNYVAQQFTVAFNLIGSSSVNLFNRYYIGPGELRPSGPLPVSRLVSDLKSGVAGLEGVVRDWPNAQELATVPVTPTQQRGAWMFEKWNKGVSLKNIRLELNKIAEKRGWETLALDRIVHQAIQRWCEANEIEMPKRNKSPKP